jgi:tRNA threonylcarbamoyladenosine biosynthesis protein TsaB
MILLLDTSTPVCRVSLVDGEWRFDDEWQADRQLAKGLLGYLEATLNSHSKSWQDLTGIGVFRGPGSFTGLRIGITVANTLADTLGIPIVGTGSDLWQDEALSKLSSDNVASDEIVLPLYGSDAHITKARK